MGDSSSSWPEDMITWLLVADLRSDSLALPHQLYALGTAVNGPWLPPVGVYRIEEGGVETWRLTKVRE